MLQNYSLKLTQRVSYNKKSAEDCTFLFLPMALLFNTAPMPIVNLAGTALLTQSARALLNTDHVCVAPE